MTFRFTTPGAAPRPASPPEDTPTVRTGPWNVSMSLLPTECPLWKVAPWPLQFAYAYRRHVLETNGTMWTKKQWEIAPTPFACLNLVETFKEIHGRDPRFDSLVANALQSREERPRPSLTWDTPIVAPLPGVPPAWAHQMAASHWLERRLSVPGTGAFLYLGMGTGKTRTVLDWIVSRDIRRVVITVPRTALPVWGEEAEKWWPGHFKVWTAGAGDAVRKRWNSLLESKTLERTDPTIVVVNYDSVWRKPFDQLLTKDWGIELVVADECHRLKGRSSERSRFFRHLWRHIPYRIALSGTPLSNGALTDAYGQYAFLDPGLFGLSMQRFEDKYAIKRQWQVLSWKNTEDFYRRFWSITRHEDRSVLDLPPLIETTRDVTLPPDARRVYDELKEDAFTEFQNKIITAPNALAIVSKLQQVASGRLLGPKTEDGTHRTVMPLHDAKKNALAEVLMETGSEPVVVFCLFREDLKQVHEVCKTLGIASLEVSGSRQELQDWKECQAPVLAVQIASGSEGISLVRAQVGVFFSPSHSLAQMEQAKSRLHRPGQNSSVTLIHLLAKNTVDVTMHRALARKIDFVEALIESKGEALNDLT